MMPRPCRILIIDDDALILGALRFALTGEGYEVVAAKGGQAGIDAFTAAAASTEPFSAVITDLGMPQVNGSAVAAAVKTISAATPVILLTGSGHVVQGLAHVDRLLGKPTRLEELRSALNELICEEAQPSGRSSAH